MTTRRALVVAVVLALVVPGPADGATAVPDSVRINIAGLGLTRAAIGSTGPLVVERPDGTTLYEGIGPVFVRRDVLVPPGDPPRPPAPDDVEERRARALAPAPVRPERWPGPTIPFEVTVAGEGRSERQLLASATLPPLRFRSSELLTLDGRAFRGSFELALDARGRMIVVNEVATSHYLASVVGAEMPSSWAPAALAAQAIAARTFLVRHLGRHPGYDLEGDQRAQEYSGVRTEVPSTIAAVRTTSGLILTHRGRPIDALYSSNAGGATDDSENVFPNPLPYLRGVPSPWDQVAEVSGRGRLAWTWTRELTPEQLAERLRARGVDVGTPQRIELAEVSAAGRVIRARIVGDRGTHDVRRDDNRGVFGVRSTLFTVARRPAALEVVEHDDGDRQQQVAALGAPTVAPLYRHVVGEQPDDEPRLAATIHRVPERFHFAGRGFGHGVGMSQWGAQGMALEGADAATILRHYYREIAITRVPGP